MKEKRRDAAGDEIEHVRTPLSGERRSQSSKLKLMAIETL